MKVCRGFTLIELMVTIAVVAILTTVAVPGFRDLIRNNRVTTQTNEVVSALNFARTEAIKRGRSVTVRLQPVGDGWSATVSTADADLRFVDRRDSGVAIVDEVLDIGFRPSGVAFRPGVPDGIVALDVQPKDGCSKQQSRRIAVGFSGQITTTRQDCVGGG